VPRHSVGGWFSSGSHQGNNDLSAKVRLLRGRPRRPQGLDLAFRVRRQWRPDSLPCSPRSARRKRDHRASHEGSAGCVHGPNRRRVWIRVADLRAAKDGEWAVTCGCHYRHCPAGLLAELSLCAHDHQPSSGPDRASHAGPDREADPGHAPRAWSYPLQAGHGRACDAYRLQLPHRPTSPRPDRPRLPGRDDGCMPADSLTHDLDGINRLIAAQRRKATNS
jgi:hypothetical protein